MRRSGKSTALNKYASETTDVRMENWNETVNGLREKVLKFFSDPKPDHIESISKHLKKQKVFILDEYEGLFAECKRSLREHGIASNALALEEVICKASQDVPIIFVGLSSGSQNWYGDGRIRAQCEHHPFPLFDDDEFSELVTKTIKPVKASKEFITALMYHTGGNVYFCVALLVAFFDWLIQSEESAEFTPDKLKDFMKTKVTTYLLDELGGPTRRQTYLDYFSFYRNWAKECLSVSPLTIEIDDRTLWSATACGATLALFQQEDNVSFEEAASLVSSYLNRETSDQYKLLQKELFLDEQDVLTALLNSNFIKENSGTVSLTSPVFLSLLKALKK